MSLLEVAGLNAYFADSHILFDVAMRVERNEVVALLGAQRHRQVDDAEEPHGCGDAEERQGWCSTAPIWPARRATSSPEPACSWCRKIAAFILVLTRFLYANRNPLRSKTL